ncbi:unnamed protein product [Urochloa humidicola]
METDGNTSNRRGEHQEEDGESGDDGERITGSIAVEAFDCYVCAEPLGPPIFECPENHFFCSSCHDKLPEGKCNLCSSSSGCASTLAHSLGMERAVRAILVACRHAAHGCAQETAYCDKDEHEEVCQHAPCLCPEPGCGFAGSAAAELLAHLTGEHKWPSTTFRYWNPFELRVVKPGAQVLHCEDDGQLFLMSVRQVAQPPGLAVSIVCVLPYIKVSKFGCTVSFSCFPRHHCNSTMDDLRPLRVSDLPPAECICVLPKASEAPVGAEVVLTTTILSPDPDYEDEDISYIHISSDEDVDGTS